jgi:hypothetical protein
MPLELPTILLTADHHDNSGGGHPHGGHEGHSQGPPIGATSGTALRPRAEAGADRGRVSKDVRWLGGSARASQGGREHAALVALMVEKSDHHLVKGPLTVGEAHLAGRRHRGEPLVG